MIRRVQSSNQLAPVERNKPYYPVSFYTQQGYWLINNLQKSNAANHQLNLYKITGTINMPLLAESILNTIDRHEVFRTGFSLYGEEPVLSIHPMKIAVRQINLENHTEELRNEELSGIMTEYIDAPFNLPEGNLIRTAVIKLKNDECLLLLVQHIIITDNSSDSILLRDVLEYYKAKMENREPVLPELPIQYLDYAVWRTHSLQGKFLDREISYWKKALEAAPPFLPLTTDYPRHCAFKKKERNTNHHFQFPYELRNKLKPLIQQMGISLAAFFLSVLKIVLYHYSNQTDILVGAPYSIRNRLELQGMLGCFINTLIIRTKIDPDQPFCDFLKQVNSSSMSAYAHGNLPLEKLIELINPERNIYYKPLIQVLFNFGYMENSAEDNNPDIKTERLLFTGDEVSYDLHLVINGDIDSNIDIYFYYNENLFKDETIAGMAHHFIYLIRSAIDDPHKKICSLKTENSQFVNRTIPVESVQQTQADDIPAAPEGPIEKALSDMFSKILKIDQVGSNSGFFKLGGHSLAAAQLISGIKHDYNIEIDFQTVFEAQTVSNLAKLITDMISPS